MARKIKAHWQLQRMVDELILRRSPAEALIGVVVWNDDDIVWDQECKGLGVVTWSVRYLIAPEDFPKQQLIALINKDIAKICDRFNLGLTCS